MGCNSEYIEYFNYCIVSCSGISAICSMFIIYLSFQKLFDKLTLRLLYHLAINDILRAICLILCIFCTEGLVRKIVSPLYVYSLVSNIFWSLYLSTTLYLSIVKGKTNQEAYYKYWLIANYIFLLGICFLPFITNSYGLTNNICSLKTDQGSLIWRIIITYVYISIITIADILLFTLIYRFLKKLEQNVAKNIILERGFIYIILIIVQYLPIIAVNLLILETSSCLPGVLQNCIHIIISLHGLFNFIPILIKTQGRKVIKKFVLFKNKSNISSLESSLDILNSEVSVTK